MNVFRSIYHESTQLGVAQPETVNEVSIHTKTTHTVMRRNGESVNPRRHA
jgi:hypothetical protein